MKQDVSFFVSFADADTALVERLMKPLELHMQTSAAHDYKTWNFKRLLIGERFHDRIQAELSACDVGLLLVSPAFLASKYIGDNELPAFVSGKPMIPVALRAIDFGLHDLRGLKSTQIFLHQGQPFEDMTTDRRRSHFALDLFRKIEGRLGTLRVGGAA